MVNEEWNRKALEFYKLHYNMSGYDRTDKELELDAQCLKHLEETVPEEYKGKYVIIGPEKACLGEDIVWAKYYLTHTRHAQHIVCQEYKIVDMYCLKCQRKVITEEILIGL